MSKLFEENQPETPNWLFPVGRAAKLEPGIYHYTVKDIVQEMNVATQFGLKDKVNITFEADTTVGPIEIVDKINISKGSDSRFQKLIRILAEAFQVRTVDLRDFIGTEGEMEVDLVETEDGNIFERIVSLKPSINTIEEA